MFHGYLDGTRWWSLDGGDEGMEWDRLVSHRITLQPGAELFRTVFRMDLHKYMLTDTDIRTGCLNVQNNLHTYRLTREHTRGGE